MPRIVTRWQSLMAMVFGPPPPCWWAAVQRLQDGSGILGRAVSHGAEIPHVEGGYGAAAAAAQHGEAGERGASQWPGDASLRPPDVEETG